MFPRDPLPDRIGPYKIVRRLASRRGADLYLGLHDGPMGFQRECVLKLVPSPSISGDASSAEELAHEARICSRLNHPGIVRMHDFFEHGDNLVLVFEHFAGVSLARLLSHFRRRRQRIPDTAVWYLAHRLFSALTHAHTLMDDAGRQTPVIHRDIQPAHLVMSQDAQVRLAGFGIAKIAGTAGTTAVGFVKGTPAYMAPEQARGEKVTERVDVYAAGLVLWEMLSGRSVHPPRDVGQGADLLKMIGGRRVDPIVAIRRDIPRELAAAIDACLEQDVDRRTVRASEVDRWLLKVVDVDAGKNELRERLVQLRNATIRPAPSPRTSLPPRNTQAQPRSYPSRYPGLATRVTGRPSEFDEGEAPRSSRRVPPFMAHPSSRPAPPIAPGHDDDDLEVVPFSEGRSAAPGASVSGRAPRPPRPGASQRPNKGTLLGLAPAPGPMPAIKHQVRAPAPSYDAVPPPPPEVLGLEDALPDDPMRAPTPSGEVRDFVSALQKPPGVRSQPPVQQRPPVSNVIVAGYELADRATGDTTIITRRTIQRARAKQFAMLGGGIALVLVVLGAAVLGVWAYDKPDASVHANASATGAGSGPPALTTTVAPPASSPPVVASAPPSSAEPVESAPAPTASANPAPPELSRGAGALLMIAPPKGTVYVSGVPMGETGEWITVSCNRHHFIRIGTRPGPRGLAGTSWLAPGQSVLVRCGIPTEAVGTPRYPVVERRRGGGRTGNFDPKSPF